jgi:hypothetical protein
MLDVVKQLFVVTALYFCELVDHIGVLDGSGESHLYHPVLVCCNKVRNKCLQSRNKMVGMFIYALIYVLIDTLALITGISFAICRMTAADRLPSF